MRNNQSLSVSYRKFGHGLREGVKWLVRAHHSRGSEVVEALLGKDFQGVLGSDFYAAYNIHQGLHQHCWIHFLCDG